MLEKWFSYYYKNSEKRNSRAPGFIAFSDYQLQVQTFVNICRLDEGPSIQVGGSLWGCGFIDHQLLIPYQLSWTKEKKMNLDLLKILVLKALAIKQLNICLEFNDRSRVQPRIFILSKIYLVNQWLDLNFPGFFDLERSIYEKLFLFFSNHSFSRRSEFHYWSQLIANREASVSDCINKKYFSSLYQEKINDVPKMYLHATVPLPIRETNLIREEKFYGLDRVKSIQTNKKRNRSESTQDIDSKKNKESVNPVSHSFEKIEAIDDYQGGRRVTSGEDELSDHEQALDEIELNHHTSEGSASSVYSQKSEFSKHYAMENEPHTQTIDKKVFIYSEWHAKKMVYLEDYCTLYEFIADETKNASLDNSMETIKNKYHKEIGYWHRRFSHLLNVPLWKNRLLEGSDLDIDSLIRLHSEWKIFSGQPRIFQDKNNLQNNISLSLLVDVSYSTDTWIDGLRVIEVIQNSVSVFGWAIETLIERISIALTFSETRKKVSYLQLKKFDDSWQDFFSRQKEFYPRQYTRLGPSIRHATMKLVKERAVQPILILITDGKPTDLDPYEGQHGENDVKKAIEEAKSKGIKVLVLTISDLDTSHLQKIFDRPRPFSHPDDFCREVNHFIYQSFIKKMIH